MAVRNCTLALRTFHVATGTFFPFRTICRLDPGLWDVVRGHFRIMFTSASAPDSVPRCRFDPGFGYHVDKTKNIAQGNQPESIYAVRGRGGRRGWHARVDPFSTVLAGPQRQALQRRLLLRCGEVGGAGVRCDLSAALLAPPPPQTTATRSQTTVTTATGRWRCACLWAEVVRRLLLSPQCVYLLQAIYFGGRRL